MAKRHEWALAVWLGVLLTAGCHADSPAQHDGGADASVVDANITPDASPNDGGIQSDAAVPPGDLIWAFSAGDLDAVAYQSLVDTFPVGSQGRPQPDQNTYRLPLPIAPQQLNFNINNEVPILLSDGRLRTYIPEVPQNQHNMFKMYNPDRLLGGSHNRMRQAYKYEFEADFSSATDWASISWCIFFQIWGSAYPASWDPPGHSRNPPIALSLDEGIFEIRVYGEHETDLESLAGNSTWTHADSGNWDFTPGPHFFEVWVTSDYREPAAGGIGAVRVDMDGQTVWERPAIVNAILTQVNNEDAGGLVMFGAYTYTYLPAPTYADVTFDNIRVYEL